MYENVSKNIILQNDEPSIIMQYAVYSNIDAHVYVLCVGIYRKSLTIMINIYYNDMFILYLPSMIISIGMYEWYLQHTSYYNIVGTYT